MENNKINNTTVDDIVRTCLGLYEKLPRKGKPVEKEWTVLSCVVQMEQSRTKPQAVALGTGSKCLGAGQMVANGTRLNDSHAEVCARRAFLLYLYNQIDLCIKNQQSIFERVNRKFRLKESIEFVFYSSQLPCGDASILPKAGEKDDYGEILKSIKRHCESDPCDDTKRLKVEGDIHRTGAKCLPGAEDDPRKEGSDYHRLGVVRTKPGRGERTLSVSCSDKMARWTHIGIQGALLHMLCGPIYIKHFIFGGGVPYSEESLRRAFLSRGSENCMAIKCVPEFYQSSVTFPYVRTASNVRPAPGSIIWALNIGTPEVAVQGRKLGLTQKKALLAQHALCITKYKLYERFLSVILNDKITAELLLGENNSGKCIQNVWYNEMKKNSKQYQQSWLELKEKFFGSWTVKPDMWNFCVETVEAQDLPQEETSETAA